MRAAAASTLLALITARASPHLCWTARGAAASLTRARALVKSSPAPPRRLSRPSPAHAVQPLLTSAQPQAYTQATPLARGSVTPLNAPFSLWSWLLALRTGGQLAWLKTKV